MRIATWNLNNRVGKVRFRPEAADAAIALKAEVVAFTEFFPQQHEDKFRAALADAGWKYQLKSADTKTGAIANRVLIASKLPIVPLPLDLPTFDDQFPANILSVFLPDPGVSILGIRVPAYPSGAKDVLFHAWNWIEAAAASLANTPSIILGDLNIKTTTPAPRGGHHFRRIMASGWRRASPTGGSSFFGRCGRRSEIDHIFATRLVTLSDAVLISQIGKFALTGSRDAISDHAALVCRITRLHATSFTKSDSRPA